MFDSPVCTERRSFPHYINETHKLEQLPERRRSSLRLLDVTRALTDVVHIDLNAPELALLACSHMSRKLESGLPTMYRNTPTTRAESTMF